jgi:hypothetical protein
MKFKGNFVPALNKVPYFEGVWRSGGKATRILNFGARMKWIISFMLRPLWSRVQIHGYQQNMRLGGGPHACPKALETIKTSFPCPGLKNFRQYGITGKSMWDLRWTTCYWKKCFIYYFCFPLSRSHHQCSTFMTQYKLSSLRVSINKTSIPSLKTQVLGDPVNDLVTVSTELSWFH